MWVSKWRRNFNWSNTSSVVTHKDFGSLNTDDPKEDDYYIVKFTSDPYNIQDIVIIYGGIVTIGEQVVNTCYLSRLIHG